MSGLETELTKRPSVIGFDGLHRVGKGTQATMLLNHIEERGNTAIIMRGDGTREGLGVTDGDPYSPEWQERSHRLKTYDRTVGSWNLASYILVRELHDAIYSPTAPDTIIVDRSILSRAAFLIHRGVAQVGSELSLEDLYPDDSEGSPLVEATIPDVLFDMQVGEPGVLLDRLDINDPKFDFRAENIRGGFAAAREAVNYLPSTIKNRVEFIDAGHEPEAIHNYIVSLLGHKGLIASSY